MDDLRMGIADLGTRTGDVPAPEIIQDANIFLQLRH